MKTRNPSKRNLPESTYLGCPLTKNQSAWCYRLCQPAQGRGSCGRVAPHCHAGRTRRAIKALHREGEVQAA